MTMLHACNYFYGMLVCSVLYYSMVCWYVLCSAIQTNFSSNEKLTK